jgi:tRNA(Ile)-lysidine synthase
VRDRILSFIREHGLIQPGDRVAAAVSGGADSVALLRILLELRDELGCVLSALHFHHKIRGADADADEQFVANLAAEHGLEFHRDSADVPAYAAGHKLSLETAGRQLRYAWFRKLLASGTMDKIATGHTLDDQAETVLMRLIRGAGTKGLAGIHPVHTREEGAVVRPLLCIRRREIENYLRSLGQPWRTDVTNVDPKHLRNRVRHQLLPVLERDFNPAIVEVLGEMAEVARAEDHFLERAAAEALRFALNEQRRQGLALDIPQLQTHPLALRRRIIRAAAERLGLTLEFRHVEQVLLLATASGGNAESQLPDGWSAVRSGRELCFERRGQTEQGPVGYEYHLNIPGEVFVKELGTRIKAFTTSIPQGSAGYNREMLLDACAAGELTVRNWRPGDRFWPAHSKGPRKVKELLQRKKVREPGRALWPVAVRGDKVVWLRGFPPPQDLLLSEHSKLALVIEEVSVPQAVPGQGAR